MLRLGGFHAGTVLRTSSLPVGGGRRCLPSLPPARQFKAMRVGYADMFPDGQFSIVLLDGRRIGRLVLHRTTHAIHVVDMVLLPEFCGQGWGRRVMNEILAEAAAAKIHVSLHVLKMNRAIRFYQRFGFVKTGDEGPYDKMEWRAVAGGA